MDLTMQNVAHAARTEAAKMKNAVQGRDPTLKVSMSAGQFTMLANLIDAMCDMLAGPDVHSFGEARYWVPLDSFIKLRDSARSLDRQCQELRGSLEEARIGRSGFERVRLPGSSLS